MNTYNENFRQTIADTLSAVSSDQAKLVSEQKSAEYTLYYAQGAEITARDKLDVTHNDIKTWQPINDQSLINANQVFNLLTSATAASADVKTSITNTAIAAANVQIASNAIADLASDIGAALNIATATLYQTDVYSKIQDANNFINEVANEAKCISKNAMDASGLTSEITIAEVLAQTETVKAKIDGMHKSTQAELDKFSKLALKENEAIGKASIAEKHAEGGFLDFRKEVEAIIEGYNNIDKQLNLGLAVTVNSGFEICVSFAALPHPFPTFNAFPDTDKKIPLAVSQYYLTLVPAQKQKIFTLNQAEQYLEQPLENGICRFAKINPDPGKNVITICSKPEENDPAPPACPESFLNADVYGDEIKQGSCYVACVYVELSKSYKQFITNYSDLLFAPSQDFTLATKLPLAEDMKLSYNKETDDEGQFWSSATFNAAPMLKTKKMADANAKEAAETATKAAKEAEEAAKTCKSAIEVLAHEEVAAANDAVEEIKANSVAEKAEKAAAIAAAGAKSAADKASVSATIADKADNAVAASKKAAKDADDIYKAAVKKYEADPDNPIKAAAAEDAHELLEARNDAVRNDEETARKTHETAEADAKEAAKADKEAADQEKKAVDAKAAAATASDKATAAANAATNAEAKVVDAKANATVAIKIAADTAKAAKTAATDASNFHNPSEAAQAAAFAVKDIPLQFQCILVEETLNPKRNYLLSDENKENYDQKIPSIYFNLVIAEKVSPANYITATPIENKPGQYKIEFIATTTDNFGNMIKPDVKYKPYILTVVDIDMKGTKVIEPKEFTQVLASCIDSQVICKTKTN